MPTDRVSSSDTIEVFGTVKALQVEHEDARDGVWVLFTHEDGAPSEWYINYLDEHATAVLGQLQLLRDAYIHGFRVRLSYTIGSPYREFHNVRLHEGP